MSIYQQNAAQEKGAKKTRDEKCGSVELADTRDVTPSPCADVMTSRDAILGSASSLSWPALPLSLTPPSDQFADSAPPAIKKHRRSVSIPGGVRPESRYRGHHSRAPAGSRLSVDSARHAFPQRPVDPVSNQSGPSNAKPGRTTTANGTKFRHGGVDFSVDCGGSALVSVSGSSETRANQLGACKIESGQDESNETGSSQGQRPFHSFSCYSGRNRIGAECGRVQVKGMGEVEGDLGSHAAVTERGGTLSPYFSSSSLPGSLPEVGRGCDLAVVGLPHPIPVRRADNGGAPPSPSHAAVGLRPPRCKSQPSSLPSGGGPEGGGEGGRKKCGVKRRRDNADDRPTLDFRKMTETAYDPRQVCKFSPSYCTTTEQLFAYKLGGLSLLDDNKPSVSDRRSLPSAAMGGVAYFGGSAPPEDAPRPPPAWSPFVPVECVTPTRGSVARANTPDDATSDEEEDAELLRYLPSPPSASGPAPCSTEPPDLKGEEELGGEMDGLEAETDMIDRDIDLDLIENN